MTKNWSKYISDFVFGQLFASSLEASSTGAFRIAGVYSNPTGFDTTKVIQDIATTKMSPSVGDDYLINPVGANLILLHCTVKDLRAARELIQVYYGGKHVTNFKFVGEQTEGVIALFPGKFDISKSSVSVQTTAPGIYDVLSSAVADDEFVRLFVPDGDLIKVVAPNASVYVSMLPMTTENYEIVQDFIMKQEGPNENDSAILGKSLTALLTARSSGV